MVSKESYVQVYIKHTLHLNCVTMDYSNSHKINVHKEGRGNYTFQLFVQYLGRYCSDKFTCKAYTISNEVAN